MKAFELAGAINTIFHCIDGEPRAWTRNPPFTPGNLGDDVPDEEKNYYAVFGYSCTTCSEEQLVDALWKDIQAMHALCTSERPTLLWRRKPEFREGTHDRKRFRTLSIRIVIPEIAHGTLRSEWLKTNSYKAECEPYPCPKEHS